MKITPDLSTVTSRQRTLLLTSALFGLAGLLLGIFGAHGIRDSVTPEDYRNYEKGVQYHYFFTVMMFVVALLSIVLRDPKGVVSVFVLFAVGVVLFSGSLYGISVVGVANPRMPHSVFLITPVGGFCFLIGWVWLIVTLVRLKTHRL